MIFFSSTSLKYFLFLRAVFLISELKISPLTSQKSWKSEYHCLYHKDKIRLHNRYHYHHSQSNHCHHHPILVIIINLESMSSWGQDGDPCEIVSWRLVLLRLIGWLSAVTWIEEDCFKQQYQSWPFLSIYNRKVLFVWHEKWSLCPTVSNHIWGELFTSGGRFSMSGVEFSTSGGRFSRLNI